MSFTILAAVGVLLVLSVLVGLAASWGRQFISDDYFLAGRTLPWYAVALGMAGASFGLLYLPGMMGLAYSQGMAPAGFCWGNFLSYSILLWIFLPFYYRKKTYSTADFLGRRYGPSTRAAFSVLVLVGTLVGVLAPVLYASGRIVCEMGLGQKVEGLDWVLALCVAVVATAVAAYSVYGGLSAAVWSSALQVFLVLAIGITLAIVGLQKFGGWEEMMAANTVSSWRMDIFLPRGNSVPQWPQALALPWTGMLAFWFTLAVWHAGASPVTVQRCLGARSEWDAKMGVIAGGVLQAVLPVIVVLPGLVVYAKTSTLDVAGGERAVPEILAALAVGDTWPGALAQCLAVTAMVAALLSAASAAVGAISAVWTVDVCQEVRQMYASEAEMVSRGRRSSLVAVILAAVMAPLLALWPGSVFDFVLEVAAILAPPAVVVFLLAFFWPRTHGRAAATTLVLGAIIGGALWVVVAAGVTPPAWMVPVLNRAGISLLASLVVFLLGTVLIPQNPREFYDPDTTWNPYWSRLPIHERDSGAGPRNLVFWWIVMLAAMVAGCIVFF